MASHLAAEPERSKGGRAIRLRTTPVRHPPRGASARLAFEILLGLRSASALTPFLALLRHARYLPTGHLLFLRRGVLCAVPFDAERLEVRGPEVAVLNAVAQALTASNAFDITGAGQFAVAPTGTLAWIASPVVSFAEAALVTVDRRGQVSPLPAPVRSYGTSVRLSPDGRRLAVVIRSLTEAGVWVYDLARGSLDTLGRRRGGRVANLGADGRRLLFDWLTDGRRTLSAQPADSTAGPQVFVSDSWLNASSVTPDGRQIAAVHEPDTDILSVAVENGQAQVQPLIETPHYEGWAEFSPDGRWLAYGSDVSGRREVYVRPFPGPGPTEQVSIDGGQSPAWHRGGKELFFVTPRNAERRWSMMAVDVDAGSARGIGRPRALFEFDAGELKLVCAPGRCYDVAPDGQRFFAVQQRPAPPPPPVTHVGLRPELGRGAEGEGAGGRDEVGRRHRGRSPRTVVRSVVTLRLKQYSTVPVVGVA